MTCFAYGDIVRLKPGGELLQYMCREGNVATLLPDLPSRGRVGIDSEFYRFYNENRLVRRVNLSEIEPVGRRYGDMVKLDRDFAAENGFARQAENTLYCINNGLPQEEKAAQTVFLRDLLKDGGMEFSDLVSYYSGLLEEAVATQGIEA